MQSATALGTKDCRDQPIQEQIATKLNFPFPKGKKNQQREKPYNIRLGSILLYNKTYLSLSILFPAKKA